MSRKSKRNRIRNSGSLRITDISSMVDSQKEILERTIRDWSRMGKVGDLSVAIPAKSLIAAASVAEHTLISLIKKISMVKTGDITIDDLYSITNQMRSDASRRVKELEIMVEREIYGVRTTY